MDKLSVDGSKIAGPARQLAYRLPMYPRDRCRTLVCSLRSEDSARDFLIQCGVEVKCLGRSKLDLRALGDLQRLAADWKPSILHLHGYASWTFGRIVGRRIGIPVIVQEHFIDKRVPAVQRVADWLLRKQQHMGLAVTDLVKEFMTDQRYVRDTPIHVTWNAVPVEAIRAEASTVDTAGLRSLLRIPPHAPIIGIVGRLAEMKGHRYFLEAAARIRQAKPDAHFVIVGAGPLRAELGQQVDRLNLGEQVHFAGHQSNVVPFLSMFDVSVLTSIYGEGTQTVALESLAAGTPVVMTNLETFRGLYADEKDVLMVPIRDPAATAAATLRLLTDHSLVKRLLDNAQPLLAGCTLEAVVENYLSIYSQLLHQPD